MPEVYTFPIQTAGQRLAKRADSTKRMKWVNYWSLVLPAFGRPSGWGACRPLAPRVLIFWFFKQMQKDLNEKRSCKISIFRHFECCHVAGKSSSFLGLLNHKILQASWKSIAFDRKTFKIHLPTAEQYLHQVNIMLLKLDLRMLLCFFRKLSGTLSK